MYNKNQYICETKTTQNVYIVRQDHQLAKVGGRILEKESNALRNIFVVLRCLICKKSTTFVVLTETI